MALVLKRNGAPLGGALFVKNPRRRRRRLNRAQRRSLKFRSLAGLGLGTLKANRRRRRRNGLAMKANPLKRNRKSRKGGILSRLLAKFKRRKNAGYRLNTRVKHNRRRHNRRHNRRGALG